MREYINTKESYFNNISDFPEVSVGKLLKKFFYYKCNECGIVKSKRIYSENRKIKVDFTCRECKYKNTSKERYGTDNPAKSEKIKEITKKNNLEKYGVDNPAKLESIKEKAKEVNLKKYGAEYHHKFGSEEFKKDCIRIYGVDNPAKSEKVKEKIKETNLKKYSTAAPCQNYEVLKKCFKNIFYDNVYFDSSWEVAYWIWCKNHNKDIKRNTQMYDLSNGTKCLPDFIVDGKIVEIKGDHLKNQKSYKYKFEFYKKNNVTVLSYDDLLPIFKEVYQEMKDKNLPLPRIDSKRDVFFINDISEIEQYKNKNCKIQYVCTNCGTMNITGYKILKHFNNLLCKKCRLYFNENN